jgi:hypothetical protein
VRENEWGDKLLSPPVGGAGARRGEKKRHVYGGRRGGDGWRVL